MRCRGLILIVIVCCIFPCVLSAEEIKSGTHWRFSLEFNQMFHTQLCMEYLYSEVFGIKAGIGVSIGTCFTYNALLVFHFNLPVSWFKLDLEAGILLGYFDFIEGRYTDFDPIIDDPFYGFLPGAGLLASIRFRNGHTLGLRMALASAFEYQENVGWKDIGFIPVFAVVYGF